MDGQDKVWKTGRTSSILFNQTGGNEGVSPFDGSITPPLRGSRRSRAGSLSLSKGRRRLMRWGDFNVFPYATISVTQHARILH